jgi:uncharacterized protein YndB with AHSA1/START domain
MDRIEQSYLIAAPLEDVWAALTDPALIEKWSGANAKYVAQPNVEYSLWDGSIGGRILEVEPHKRLYKTWKPDNWTRTDSVVTFLLSPARGGTRVDLVHENVEESDFEGTSEGWNVYYLGAIQRMFERKKPSSSPKKTAATKKKVRRVAKVKVKSRKPLKKKAKSARRK